MLSLVSRYFNRHGRDIAGGGDFPSIVLSGQLPWLQVPAVQVAATVNAAAPPVTALGRFMQGVFSKTLLHAKLSTAPQRVDFW